MNRSSKHRVGIFGGTFDPIHIGHLFIAQAAYETLGLSKVVFIPSGRPPHKEHSVRASDDERVEMLKLAVSGNEMFDTDLIEMHSEEYSFSYVTMQKLAALHPENEYFFLVGEDSLRDLDRWRHPEILVKYCNIAVAGRKGVSDIPVEELMEKQRKTIGGEYFYVDCPFIDISSTEIRRRISEGLSVKYYLPDSIIQYIKEKHLYI